MYNIDTNLSYPLVLIQWYTDGNNVMLTVLDVHIVTISPWNTGLQYIDTVYNNLISNTVSV